MKNSTTKTKHKYTGRHKWPANNISFFYATCHLPHTNTHVLPSFFLLLLSRLMMSVIQTAAVSVNLLINPKTAEL